MAPESLRPDEATATRAHHPALDGVRGVAILLVMLHHFSLAPRTNLWLDWLFWKVTLVGWCGVDLFFVLSGFLITGVLLDGVAAGDRPRNFYVRRALRIVPVYYALLAGILLVQPHFSAIDQRALSHLVDRQAWYWGFASNVLVTRPGEWDSIVPWTSHFWSLAVEEQFYLVWPLVLWSCRRRTAVVVCLLAILASALLRAALSLSGKGPITPYVWTPARLDGLAIGALIAIALRHERWRDRLARWFWPTITIFGSASLVLLAMTPYPQNFHPLMQAFGLPTLAILFGGILVRVHTNRGGTLSRLLSVPPLRSAGRYSYAAYLLHYPVIWALAERYSLYDLAPRIAGSGLPSTLLLIAMAGAASFALALLSWHLLERHALRLKDRFPYGGGERASPRPLAQMGLDTAA